MGNQVYANNMEVSCKAADGKAIASFPDVCFTPPQTPATPPGVPIPYPNTGMASDATDGSKTVKISGQEVMLKNKSYFKKSSGDEAGSAPKKGVVTSKNMGKVYFTAWSMDVKFEGENVVRHLDMTTHNHGSTPPNTGPWPYTDAMDRAPGGKCEKDAKAEKNACKDFKPHGPKDPCLELDRQSKPPQVAREIAKPIADSLSDEVALQDCLSKRRCFLQPYKPNAEQKASGSGCCPPQTGHHLVEAAAFFENRPVGDKGNALSSVPNSPTKYHVDQAPCACAEGTGNILGGTHELMHAIQSSDAAKCPVKTLPLANGGSVTTNATTYGKAKQNGADAFKEVFKDSHCDEECLKKQLDDYHNRCGVNDNTEIKAVTTPTKMTADQARAEANRRYSEVLLTRMARA